MKKQVWFFAGLIALGTLGTSRVQAQTVSLPRLPMRASVCDPGEVDFIKQAIYYARNAKISGGKSPAVFATISMVSLEAGATLGGVPDRTQVWYAYGQLMPSADPNIQTLEGKFPFWFNNGSPTSPFSGGQNNTLGVVVELTGRTSLHYQVDGRNRMGKGPEFFDFTTTPSASPYNTMFMSTTAKFQGQKRLITISLTRGETTLISTLAAGAGKTVNEPRGARYKITPTFVVTQADDGIADNTLEVEGVVYLHNEQQLPPGKEIKAAYPTFNFSGKRGAGGVILGKPFFIDSYSDQPKTTKVYVRGYAYDRDTSSGDDLLWSNQGSVWLESIAKTKSHTRIFAGDGNSDSGNVEIIVEKVADLH